MSATLCLKACLIPPPLSIQTEETCFATVGDLFSYRLGWGGGGIVVLLFPVKLSSSGATVRATRFHKAFGPDTGGERHFPLPARAFRGGQMIKRSYLV